MVIVDNKNPDNGRCFRGDVQLGAIDKLILHKINAGHQSMQTGVRHSFQELSVDRVTVSLR